MGTASSSTTASSGSGVPAKSLHRLAVVGAIMVALTAPQLPAWAATAPTLSGLTGVVGDRAAVLTWTSGGTGTAIVRDITGLPEPVTPADGIAVPVTGLTARDATFTNQTSHRYAVWAVDSDDTTSAAPQEVTIAPAPAAATALTLTPSTTELPYGRGVVMTGRLTRSGVAAAGEPVTLYGRVLGSSVTTPLRHLTTAADGTVRSTLGPTRSMVMSLTFAGDAFSVAATSNQVLTHVLARLSAQLAPPATVLHEVTVLHGQVLPPVPGALLTVERKVGTTWRPFTHARTASNGTYGAVLAPALGVYQLRVLLPAASTYVGAVSAPVVLRVDPRDLSDGMSGGDVLAVQLLLARLHYQPGPANGYYGYDVHHAVMAFQKVERLPATGFWTKLERARTAHPAAWRVRYPGVGRAVEVDITRQVLVLSEHGVVRAIVDVSTGTERPYTFKGVTDVAHTPRGRFSVFFKVDGIRISPLGALYRPSFFYRGWAIHGSASVPNYPASHGCIRITNGNADRLFPLLGYGTTVSLYDE